MKQLLILFILSFFMVPMANAQDSIEFLSKNEYNIELFIGEQLVVPMKGIKKYSEGTEGIVDVRRDNTDQEFVLLGVAVGRTQFLFLMEDGRKVKFNVRVKKDPINRRDNIRLDVFFVQISTTDNMNLGILWPGEIAADVSVNSSRDFIAKSSTLGANITSTVIPRIDLSQIHGWGKVKRRATVVSANGENGSFDAGEEIFYQVATNQQTAIRSIKFGSIIKMTPVFDKKTGRLDIDISADVSEQGQLGPDGFANKVYSNISTKVNLRLGESVLLSGLDSQAASKSTGGIPGLSMIPILGHLFGTRFSASKRTENLIFVVPSILETVDYNDQNRIKDAFKILKTFDGDWNRSLYELTETTK